MPDLSLRFEIPLRDYTNPWPANGPAFHRWLPDGERDALALDTEDPAAELRVWFERRGYIGTEGPDEGFIRYSPDRREVDPAIMERQGVLEAGPLLGAIGLRDVPNDQFRAVAEGRTGDPAYVALGKRVVKRVVYPPVSRLIDILRTTYGQFWFRPLAPWDSRRQSLGN
jgi:hypothetical protein